MHVTLHYFSFNLLEDALCSFHGSGLSCYALSQQAYFKHSILTIVQYLPCALLHANQDAPFQMSQICPKKSSTHG